MVHYSWAAFNGRSTIQDAVLELDSQSALLHFFDNIPDALGKSGGRRSQPEQKCTCSVPGGVQAEALRRHPLQVRTYFRDQIHFRMDQPHGSFGGDQGFGHHEQVGWDPQVVSAYHLGNVQHQLPQTQVGQRGDQMRIEHVDQVAFQRPSVVGVTSAGNGQQDVNQPPAVFLSDRSPIT